MRAFGIPSEQIEKAVQIQPGCTFAVFPENWRAVQFFVLCTTQWRTDDTQPTGLDYSALGELLRIYRVRDRAAVFEKVRCMELAALNTFREMRH